jgi:hypothetical protein
LTVSENVTFTLQNGFTKMKELGSSFVNIKVDYRGTVTWQPFEIFESHCTVDTKYFPFDEQTCACYAQITSCGKFFGYFVQFTNSS